MVRYSHSNNSTGTKFCIGYFALVTEAKYVMPKMKERKVYLVYNVLEVLVHTQLTPKQGDMAEG